MKKDILKKYEHDKKVMLKINKLQKQICSSIRNRDFQMAYLLNAKADKEKAKIHGNYYLYDAKGLRDELTLKERLKYKILNYIERLT